mmetsp:Transcript_21037/g.49373  ORF Transcript_21037/g.49373 Transcript_21037/m.49373 type:complete len:207 (+) Transcript_21037:1570-2190(+)
MLDCIGKATLHRFGEVTLLAHLEGQPGAAAIVNLVAEAAWVVGVSGRWGVVVVEADHAQGWMLGLLLLRLSRCAAAASTIFLQTLEELLVCPHQLHMMLREVTVPLQEVVVLLLRLLQALDDVFVRLHDFTVVLRLDVRQCRRGPSRLMWHCIHRWTRWHDRRQSLLWLCKSHRHSRHAASHAHLPAALQSLKLHFQHVQAAVERV